MIDYSKKWIHDNVRELKKFGYIYVEGNKKQRIIEKELKKREIEFISSGNDTKIYEVEK